MTVTSKSPLASLDDPTPPVPGAVERAAVQARADHLMRRRRLAQGAGALVCTVLIGVGVVALVRAPGSDSGTGRVETASAPEPVTAVTDPEPAPTTAPAAVTPAPAPTEAPSTEAAPDPASPASDPEAAAGPETETPSPAAAAEPVLASVTATASSVPPGVTLEVTLVGDGGTFSTSTTTGVVTFDGIPPGAYEARWSWQSDDGATAVGRIPVTLAAGPNTFAL